MYLAFSFALPGHRVAQIGLLRKIDAVEPEVVFFNFTFTFLSKVLACVASSS